MIASSSSSRSCFFAKWKNTRRAFSTSSSSSSTPSSAPHNTPKPATLQQLREQVRAGDLEMYLCGSLMPGSSRESVFVMRALNIELAGIRDSVRGNPSTGRLRFGFWRDVVNKAYERSDSSSSSSSTLGAGRGGLTRGPATAAYIHPLFTPLANAIARHRHTKRWLERVIDAREEDLEAPPPRTLVELDNYGERTAASLLYLALEAVDVRNEAADEAAGHIGKAAAIALLLRSLPVHCRLGQRYIPDDVMSKHSITEADLFIRPEEVTTIDGKPIVAGANDDGGGGHNHSHGHGHSHNGVECTDPSHNNNNNYSNNDNSSNSSVKSASRGLAMTLARSGSGFGSAISIESSGSASTSTTTTTAKPASPPIKKPAADGSSSSGIRLAMSPAAARLAAASANKTAAGTSSSNMKPLSFTTGAGTSSSSSSFTKSSSAAGVSAGGGGGGGGAEAAKTAAASAVLKSGVGASQLFLHKPAETVEKIRSAVFDLACHARAHVETARELMPKVPTPAHAALLPAVPISRFLDRLESQKFDVFAAGGLGPWQDGRAWSRVALQVDLLKHTLRNTY